jgi:signal transduction histidine kinase
MLGWLRSALRPVARSLTPGDRFALFSFDPDDPAGTVPAVAGSRVALSDAGRTLLRRVLASGQIEVVKDAAADADMKDAAAREGFGAAIALPLQVRGRTVGVASVYFDSAETLQSVEALDAIERLRGSHVAIAAPPVGSPAPAAPTHAAAPAPPPAQGPSMMELVSAIMGEAVGRLDAEFDRAEEMSEANRLKSEFISVVSHELRSPLTYVFGFSEILANREVSVEQVKHVASSIHRESELMLRMVEELLDLSSIEQGKYPINLEPTDLSVQVARTVERAQPSATNHTLVAESPPSLMIMADPNRLQQVILNLVNNAVRYSPNGGTITVRALVEAPPAGRPAMARVEVADQGVGIPPHELQRIFERFHRVDNELKKKVRGSGLGLSICQAIVEGHGGRIWVESEVGVGSTFKFTLPLAAAAAQPAETPAAVGRAAKVS